MPEIAPAGYNITRVINNTPSYFLALSTIISQSSAQLLNYMRWHAILAYVSSFGTPYLDVILQYEQAVYGITSLPPRTTTCIALADEALGFIVGQMFVEQFFSPLARTIANTMVDEIRTAFQQTLPTLSWLDSTTAKLVCHIARYLLAV